MRVVRRRNIFSLCKFKVNWGKNMHNFYQLGKKYAFSPLFLSPFNHFFPNLLSGHIFAPPPAGRGGGQTEKYTPLCIIQCYFFSMESVDQVGRRERFLQSNFESLSGTQDPFYNLWGAVQKKVTLLKIKDDVKEVNISLKSKCHKKTSYTT